MRSAEGALLPALFSYATREFGQEYFEEAWEEFFLWADVPDHIEASKELGTTFDRSSCSTSYAYSDAPHTVAGWRAFISMSNRAWGKPRMLKAQPHPIQSAPTRNLHAVEGGGAQRTGVIPLRHGRKGPGRRSS